MGSSDMNSNETKAPSTADDPGPPSRNDPEFTLPLAPRGQPAAGVTSHRVHPDDALELRRVCIECAQEVFDIYRCAIELHDEDATTNLTCTAPVAAIIGFGGEQLRGTLTIVAPFRLFQSSYPSVLPDTAEAAVDVLDWAGEFANQLLGQVKRRLLGGGVELIASIPRVMLGNEFRATGEPVGIWVDAIANGETPVLAGKIEAQPDNQGEEMLLF
jgi:hypothetical protein